MTEDFVLPKMMPDFASMSRDALEDYAANVDYLYRAASDDGLSRAHDYKSFFKALNLFRAEQCKPLRLQACQILCCLKPTFRTRDALHSVRIKRRVKGVSRSKCWL